MDRVLAIARLRLTLLVRRSRGATGVLSLLAGALTVMLGSLLALGLALGFGFMTWRAGADGDPQAVRVAFLVAFYTAAFFALVMPVFTGAMNPGFDAAPLRIFPISRGRLYAITLGAGALNAEQLLNYPVLASVFLMGVLAPGVNVPLGLAGALLFVLFLIGWGNTIALALMGLMRNRRVREIVGIGVFALLVAVSIAPALLQDDSGKIDVESHSWIGPAIETMAGVGRILPPTLAADALSSLHGERPAWAAFFWLLAWDVAGILLGFRVFARHVVGDAGGRRRVEEKRTIDPAPSEPRVFTWDHAAFSFIPVEVRAVASKEIRYLLRSSIGKFNLVMAPVFAIIVVFAFGRNLDTPVLGLVPDDVLLFGMLLYATLFSNNFVNNAFGWEREGMQAYFLVPVSTRRILAGKNLGVWTYNGIVLILMMTTWCLLKGIPAPGTLFTAAVFYASCMLAFTSAGNVVSVLFPAGRDMSTLRNTPSQVAILLSLVFILAIGALAGFSLVLPLLLDMPALRPVSLLVLLAVLSAIYTGTLRLAGSLMVERREKLIETLRVVD